MIKLSNTPENIALIQAFIDETGKRIRAGVEIEFTRKAFTELKNLMSNYDINDDDIQDAILNLTVKNYHRGIDPSANEDFNVCSFCVVIGDENVEIYLKYGLENQGIQILVFSNHTPDYPMNQPFK
jgi:hypothetical protein